MASRNLSIKTKVDNSQAKRALQDTAKDMQKLGSQGAISAKQINGALNQTNTNLKSLGRQGKATSNELNSSMSSYAKSVLSANGAVDRLKNSIHGLKGMSGGIDLNIGGGSGGGGLGAGLIGGAIGSQSFKWIAKLQDRFRSLGPEIVSINAASVAAAGSVGGLAGGIGKAIGPTAAWATGIVALTAAITGLTAKGDALRTQEEAFNNLSTTLGQNSKQIIDDLRAISNETISTADLMSSAGRSMLLGIPADKLDDLMKIARATMKITGQTAEEAFADITLAVGRQSRMILDNLGIIVNMEEAYKNLATQLGKNVDQLTDAEKKQAFMNETLRKGNEMVEQIGLKTGNQREGLKKLGAAWKNFVNDMSKAVSTIFSPAVNYIAEAIAWLLQKTADAAAWVTSLLSDFPKAATGITDINKLLEIRNDLMERASEYQNDLDDPYGGLAADNIYKQVDALDAYIERLKTAEKLKNRKDTAPGLTEDQLKEIEAKEKRLLEIKQQTQVRILELMGMAETAELMQVQQKYEKLFAEAVGNKDLMVDLTEARRLEILAVEKKYDEIDAERRKDELMKRKKEEEEIAAQLEEVRRKIAQRHQEMLDNNPWLAWVESAKTASYMVQEFAVQAAESFASGMTDSLSDWIDGVKDAKTAFLDFAASFLREIAKMIMQQTILNALKSYGGGLFGFLAAEGGITSGHFQPIHAFAEGGVVSRPTLGMVGEGGESEAIIPLSKLNKMLHGGRSSNTNVSVTVNNSPGGGNMSMEQARHMSIQVKHAVAQAIRQEVGNMQRAGGQLNRHNTRTN